MQGHQLIDECENSEIYLIKIFYSVFESLWIRLVQSMQWDRFVESMKEYGEIIVFQQ